MRHVILFPGDLSNLATIRAFEVETETVARPRGVQEICMGDHTRFFALSVSELSHGACILAQTPTKKIPRMRHLLILRFKRLLDLRSNRSAPSQETICLRLGGDCIDRQIGGMRLAVKGGGDGMHRRGDAHRGLNLLGR